MAATATARTSTRAARRRRSRHTPAAGFVPVVAAAGAVGGLADSRMFVWLTRGRLWIGLLGALLVGIVGLNVIALSFSASESEAGQAADSLRRQNSAFRAQIAGRLSNSEIQAAAADLGLVMPGPGAFTYVQASPGDAAEAARRLRAREIILGVSAVAPPVDIATATTDTAPVETAATAPVETTDPSVADPAVTEAPPTAPATEAPATAAAETAASPSASAGAVGAP